jgi:hypothetical protein
MGGDCHDGVEFWAFAALWFDSGIVLRSCCEDMGQL